MAAKVKATRKAASKSKPKAAKAKKVNPIPDGYPLLSPMVILERCGEALDFMKKVFGAKEWSRFAMPDGKIGHAELAFGSAVLMLGDAMPPQFPPAPARLTLRTKDVDATYRAAVAAGATSKEEPKTQFYGERTARVTDPFGNDWFLMTHVEDVSHKEMLKRMAAMPPPA
jgi:PhnB protein